VQINNKSKTMMSHRQAALQRLSMSTYDKLYNDAHAHKEKLQAKKQQLECSSDSDKASHQQRGSTGHVEPWQLPSTMFSHDAGSPRMRAGDRLYAYQLKKEVCLDMRTCRFAHEYMSCGYGFCSLSSYIPCVWSKCTDVGPSLPATEKNSSMLVVRVPSFA
jgi:hypothetical protein